MNCMKINLLQKSLYQQHQEMISYILISITKDFSLDIFTQNGFFWLCILIIFQQIPRSSSSSIDSSPLSLLLRKTFAFSKTLLLLALCLLLCFFSSIQYTTTNYSHFLLLQLQIPQTFLVLLSFYFEGLLEQAKYLLFVCCCCSCCSSSLNPCKCLRTVFVASYQPV